MTGIESLLGLAGLAVVFSVTLCLAFLRPNLALVLLAAFSLRAAAAIFHFYVAPLPDSTADAVDFERLAWSWGGPGLQHWWWSFPGINSNTYSWFLAFIYAVTDRSALLLQSTSVMAGVLCVYVTWHLAQEMWDHSSATIAAWIVACFPMLVLYSAFVVREAWIVLSLLVGLFYVVRWSQTGNLRMVIYAVLAFAMATVLHGGMFVALIAVLALVAATSFRSILNNLIHRKLKFIDIIAISVVSIIFGVYVFSGISLPKLGNAHELISADRWMHYFESRVYGRAAYPDWVQPNSAFDFIWAVPLRAAYLLFSPFVWDVNSPRHWVGFVDGLFYLALVFLLIKNFNLLRQNSAAMAVFCVLVPLIFAFGVGTGNFGTALRHRAKFVAAIIVLIAPQLARLNFRSLIDEKTGVKEKDVNS